MESDSNESRNPFCFGIWGPVISGFNGAGHSEVSKMFDSMPFLDDEPFIGVPPTSRGAHHLEKQYYSWHSPSAKFHYTLRKLTDWMSA